MISAIPMEGTDPGLEGLTPIPGRDDERELPTVFGQEPRAYGGKDPIHVMSGFGVGGGTLVWSGVTPRYHEQDFRIKTLDGVGVDWPITYDDLAPYYDRVERD